VNAGNCRLQGCVSSVVVIGSDISYSNRPGLGAMEVMSLMARAKRASLRGDLEHTFPSFPERKF